MEEETERKKREREREREQKARGGSLVTAPISIRSSSSSATVQGGRNGLINPVAALFPQKTNIQQLKEEIREKLPEATTAEGNNGGASVTGSATNSTTTGTLRHRKNRPAPQPPQRPSSHNGAISAPEQLEIRAPSELFFGVPSSLKTQWRHQPKTLVTGCVTYVANVSAFAFLSSRFSRVAAIMNYSFST